MSLFADVLTEAVRQRGEARRKDHDVAVAAWKRFEAAVLDGASQRPLAAADVEVPQVSLRQLREIIGDCKEERLELWRNPWDEVPRRLPAKQRQERPVLLPQGGVHFNNKGNEHASKQRRRGTSGTRSLSKRQGVNAWTLRNLFEKYCPKGLTSYSVGIGACKT